MKLVYPLRHIYVTQPWGINKNVYERFGLLGHNGTDYRLFDEDGTRSTTAILYAPHDGKVIEARSDPNGYGLFLKIENASQGSILGHLMSFNVKVGDIIKTGQRIGICDNTGFSTGSHLHWGYYPIPRNKDNGYSGTIDQEKLPIMQLSEWEKIMGNDEALIKCNQDVLAARTDRGNLYHAAGLVPNPGPDLDYDNKKAVKRISALVTFESEILESLKAGDLEGSLATIAGLRSRITDLGNQLGTFQAEVENRKEQVSRLEARVTQLTTTNKNLTTSLNKALKDVDECAKAKGSLAIELAKAKQAIETLKAGGNYTPPARSWFQRFLELLTIKRGA